jgi:serine-type D-Ala-D-Ala carboxypeptidase (penicillin-binding protein 5/6)
MMHPILKTLGLTSCLLAAWPVFGFETRAQYAWVYDVTTHTVLLDKDGEASVPPASMSKLMTLYMLFEAVRDGRVTLETTFGVSAEAVKFTAAGGSTMYLQQGDRPTAMELIRGMIINSGNDACTVVAEGLAGSEDAFAALMNERAKAIGLENSNFANSSGWPDPRHRMSMKDLGILSLRLIEDYPEFYPIFAETDYDYKNRAPANSSNRNPLLGMGIGADGLKTGHTQEAGFGLAGSVKQGDRRIVFAFSGTETASQRAEEAERISSWAFRQFSIKTLAKAGVPLASASVFLGKDETVGLAPAQDIRLLVPATIRDGVKAEVVYSGPLAAPVAAGSQVAELVIHAEGLPEKRIPLLASNDVAKAGPFGRIKAAAVHLYQRFFGPDEVAA